MQKKRCPFCGWVAMLSRNSSGWWYVQCHGCGISTLERACAKDAIASWNRRFNSDEYEVLGVY